LKLARSSTIDCILLDYVLPDGDGLHVLESLRQSSDDAIFSVGTDLVVQTWNAGARRLFGYDEAEASGRAISELIIPGAYEAERCAIYAAAASTRAAVLKETVRRHKDGHLI
jgi:PAS domain S-box-containing protein